MQDIAVVHAESSDSSNGNGQPKVRVLPRPLMMKTAKDVLALKPGIVREAPFEMQITRDAFQMEVTRDALGMIAPLFTEFKPPAKCIAQSIGVLTVLKYHFENEVPIRDVQ